MKGSKAYSESFDLVHRREASGPNAIWQADHAQLDILLVREDGSAARPWLTAVIDDHSWAIAGYYLGFEAPSSLLTSLALRQGIWRKGDPHWYIGGIPDVLYTDNGTDFKSRHIEQAAADLKIRLVFSTPGKPQGRGRIERFFGQSTKCSCAISTAIADAHAASRLSPLANCKPSFTPFFWTSITAGQARTASSRRRRSGRMGGSFHACRTLWNNWICCSCRRCAPAGYDGMAFTFTASDTSL